MFKKILIKIAKAIISFGDSSTFVKVEVGSIESGTILKNKKIVITGGGSGLGLAMAKKFVAEGAQVVISGRNEEKLKNAAQLLGEKCKTIVFDVCDIENINVFLSKCCSLLEGDIDCLVSNAGVSMHENNYKEVTINGFDNQFNINFRGNYFLCKEFLQSTIEKNKSNTSLLIISSETGNMCYDIPYGMTKAALNSMTQAFARRVYSNGIRVNALAPGVTLSDMTKSYAEKQDGNMYNKRNASGRYFLPEEVAEIACFLLSDASKCISGEVIHTNAGNHLRPFWD